MSDAAPDRTEGADDDTRGRILAVAMHRFARAGYGDTSVKDIATDAGVTTGAIYHYFGSKQTLYREVGVRALEQVLGTFRELTTSIEEQSQRERVQALFETLSTMVYEHEDDHWIGVTLELDAVRHPAVAETRDEWAHHFEHLFQVAGDTDPDPNEAGWDRDPALVLMLVLSLGGVCTVVRNGPGALQVATRSLQEFLAGSPPTSP